MPPSLPAKSVFGRRLRQAREMREMSQTALGLAALSTVDENTAAPRISKYERGVNTPKFETIEQLAAALDIPAAYFVTESDDLSEAILLFAQLPARQRREAIALLRKMVEARKKR